MKNSAIILSFLLTLFLAGCTENLEPSLNPKFNGMLSSDTEGMVSSSSSEAVQKETVSSSSSDMVQPKNYVSSEKNEECFSLDLPDGWLYDTSEKFSCLVYAPDKHFNISTDPYWKLNIYGIVNNTNIDSNFARNTVQKKIDTKQGTKIEEKYWNEYLLFMTKYPSLTASGIYNYYYAGVSETRYTDAGNPYVYIINFELCNCPEDFYEEAVSMLQNSLQFNFTYQE